MATIRTTIYLSETDRHALAQLQAAYGVSTLSDAIRLAVRTCARSLAAQDDDDAIRQEVTTTTRAELTQSQSELAATQAEVAASRAELAQLHRELQHTEAQCQAHVAHEACLSLAGEAPAHGGAPGALPVAVVRSPRREQLWAVLQQTRAQVTDALGRARTLLEQRRALRQAREAARGPAADAPVPAEPV